MIFVRDHRCPNSRESTEIIVFHVDSAYLMHGFQISVECFHVVFHIDHAQLIYRLLICIECFEAHTSLLVSCVTMGLTKYISKSTTRTSPIFIVMPKYI